MILCSRRSDKQKVRITKEKKVEKGDFPNSDMMTGAWLLANEG